MSSGTATFPIADDVTIIGVRPVSTTMRVGLEAPEADGTKTGNAAASDFKKGCPCYASEWAWFNIGRGTSRTGYCYGGTSDVIEIVTIPG